jgi:hypothetical protein
MTGNEHRENFGHVRMSSEISRSPNTMTAEKCLENMANLKYFGRQ